MTAYIGMLRKEKNSDFGVDFPDFPGCVTAGRTLDEARRMAVEALAFHIDGMREDGQDVPPPSSLEAVMADRRNEGAVAVLVDLPEKPERALRINVTPPEDLVRSIDRLPRIAPSSSPRPRVIGCVAIASPPDHASRRNWTQRGRRAT
jgi:predicted RNase H-like HicB family nuclease